MAEEIYHATKSLVEHFLYLRPDMAAPLECLGVLSLQEGRMFQPQRHPELEYLSGIVDPFKVRMVQVVGLVSVVALVSCPDANDEHEMNAKNHGVWYVIGDQSRVEMQSWTKINAELVAYFAFKDFMPESFCRKITYITSWSGRDVQGMMFSECWAPVRGKNACWTLGDPSHLPLKNAKNVTHREIIDQILLDMREGIQCQ